jgi:hypothetical protein
VVKNTGETELTNVIVRDTLPNYIASATATTTAPSAVSGDLFKEGVTIAKLGVGQTATIEVIAVIKDVKQVPCGVTKLVNKVSSETDQTKVEDRLDNNSATTTINRNCPPPSPPPAKPTEPTKPNQPPQKPHTPEYVVAAGPAETAVALIGLGAITFGAVAYMRSRKDLVSKLLNK